MPTLHWLTRDEDIGAASRAPYRLLEEAPELSAGDAAADNMLIQGDRLNRKGLNASPRTEQLIGNKGYLDVLRSSRGFGWITESTLCQHGIH